jgi:hypothetical protein
MSVTTETVQRISLPAIDNLSGFTFALISVSVLIRMRVAAAAGPRMNAASGMRRRRLVVAPDRFPDCLEDLARARPHVDRDLDEIAGG